MRKPLREIVIGNAAGTVKTRHEALEMLRGAATRCTIGSTTVMPRDGNIPAPHPTFYFDDMTRTGINALGLTNQGLEAVDGFLRDVMPEAARRAKTVAMSIAGFTPQEYVYLYHRFVGRVDIVEFNFGCPNVYGTDAARKPIPSYDPELCAEILQLIKHADPEARIGVKISPVDDAMLEKLVETFLRSGIVMEVVAVNTIGGKRFQRPDGTDALSFRANPEGPILHEGGLSGSPVKKDGLRIAKLLRTYMPDTRIIGCGSIFTGEDAGEYLDLGIDGFESATAVYQYGPGVLGEIVQGLV